MIQEFEQEQSARKAQAEDDQALATALNMPKTKKTRFPLQITVTTPSSSLTAHIDFPDIGSEDEADVQLRLSKKRVEIPQEEEEAEHTSLMQRTTPSTTEADSEAIVRLQSLLEVVHPRIRGPLIRRLRALLQARLRRNLGQSRLIMQLLLRGILGDADTPGSSSASAQTTSRAWPILHHIQNDEGQMGTNLSTKEEMLGEMVELQAEMLQSTGSVNTSANKPPPSLRSSTTTTPLEVANEPRDYIMQQLLDGIVDDREQSLRELVKHIITEVQRQSFNMGTLIMLLSDLLPQPNSPEITGRQVRTGRRLFGQKTLREHPRSFASSTGPSAGE